MVKMSIMGLRPEPGPSATKQARDRHAASEPAWRLLHAVTLLQLHQARTRVHMGPRLAACVVYGGPMRLAWICDRDGEAH